jgi:hypothetical protein
LADEDVVLRIAADVRAALQALDDIKTGVRGVREPAEEAASGLEHLFMKMTGAATVGDLLSHAIESTIGKLFDLAKNSLDAGARLEQLAGVAEFLGNRAGYSSPFIKQMADQMQATGITGREAYDAMIQLTRASIPLEMATKLQAAAQNSAAIAGKSSSETMGLLIRGITTLQPQLLESAGYTISLQQAENEFAKANGVTTASLTIQQKQMLLLNSVMSQSEQIAGVYGKSMEYAAKQQTSLTRVIEQLEERLGTALIPLTTEVTKLFLDWAEKARDLDFTWLNEGAKALAGFIGDVVTELSKPDGLLAALGRLGKEVAQDAVSAFDGIEGAIKQLLISLHLMKDGQNESFTQFWIDKIRATTKEIDTFTHVLDKVADFFRWTNANGGIIGYVFNTLTGQVGELPKVTSAWEDLKNRGYKPTIDTAALLNTGNKDLIAGLHELELKSVGYVKGGGLPVVESHKQTAAEAKAAAKAAKDFADSMYALESAASGTSGMIATLDGKVYEGIKYYLQRGVAVNDLVRVYGVTKEQVKAVSDEMKFEQSVLDATTKVFKNYVAVIPDGSQAAREHMNVLRDLTKEGLIPVTKSYEGMMETMPGLESGQKKITKAIDESAAAAKQARIEGIDKLAQSLAQLAQIAPDALKPIVQGLGAIVGATSAASKGIDVFKGGFAEFKKPGGDILGGITGMVSGIAGIASAAITMGTVVVKAFKSIFGIKDEWQKVTDDIVRDYDVKISKELADKIAADSKTIGDRTAATLNHLGDVIREAGGITVANVDKFTAKTHDLFSMLEKHALTTEQVTKQLDDVFPQLAKTVTDSNKWASQSFLDLIKLDSQFGTNSKAVADYVKSTITGTVIPGLNAWAAAAKDAGDKAIAKAKEVADLQDKLAKATTQTDKDELQKQIAAAQFAVDSETKSYKSLSVSTQAAADGMAAAIVASFNELRKQGVSAQDALKQMNPAIDQLDKNMNEMGLGGSAAFDLIRKMSREASDEVTARALTSVDGLTNAMRGLYNSGLMDQTMFTGLSSQVTTTFNGLIAQGKDGDTVMRLMQPTLQMLYEAQKKFGFSVDETTQSMLNEAQKNGIVGDQYMSTNDRMLAATDRMVFALEGIAKQFGVDIPAATDEMARRGTGAAGQIEGALKNQAKAAADDLANRLNTTPWEGYGGRAQSAASVAAGALAGVGGAASTAASNVANSSGAWDAWANRAADAAAAVRREVDGISFGSSPGGIKEWKPMLNESIAHFREFGRQGVESMRSVRGAVDNFGLNSDISMSVGATRVAAGLTPRGSLTIVLPNSVVANDAAMSALAQKIKRVITKDAFLEEQAEL